MAKNSLIAADSSAGPDRGGRRVVLIDAGPKGTARDWREASPPDVGLTVELAEDGRVVMEKAKSGNYALILMGMQMPEMDSLNATRQIRQLPGHWTTPILAMTANAFAEDKDRCFGAGVNDFISKPVKPESFYAMLLKWLEQHRS